MLSVPVILSFLYMFSSLFCSLQSLALSPSLKASLESLALSPSLKASLQSLALSPSLQASLQSLALSPSLKASLESLALSPSLKASLESQSRTLVFTKAFFSTTSLLFWWALSWFQLAKTTANDQCLYKGKVLWGCLRHCPCLVRWTPSMVLAYMQTLQCKTLITCSLARDVLTI